MGEASHGTREFYQERAEITKRLIEEKDFRAVALEADWPDASRVHRYVTGAGNDQNAEEALRGFRRFPTWMWRNTVFSEFTEWLKARNDRISNPSEMTGIFGLDLYSLYTSIEAVLAYLDRIDPRAARRARDRYACFDQFGNDAQKYGAAAGYGVSESCENDVVRMLVELRRSAADYASR